MKRKENISVRINKSHFCVFKENRNHAKVITARTLGVILLEQTDLRKKAYYGSMRTKLIISY